MMELPDILGYKYPNAKLRIDIKLADYGQGPQIQEWNLDEPLPTKQDLDAWAIEFDLVYRQQQARNARVYPSINTQLDMQYHDKIDNTDTWGEAIAAVKAAHPIPTE